MRCTLPWQLFRGVTSVSWNFQHIVHFQKIPQYNAVNALHGYNSIAIHSPREVINDDDTLGEKR